MQPAPPSIDWSGLINKGLLMAIPTLIQVFWPYILLLAVLFGIKHYLRSSRKSGPSMQARSERATTPASARSSTAVVPRFSASAANCALCGKVVSEKVEAYCRNHATRFDGQIYCFEHQKTVRMKEA